MKKFQWFGLASLLVAVPVLAFVGLVHAQSFAKSVNKGEVVNSSIYAAGKTVEIDGTVNGDVYCAGSNVNIDGVVNGDVICAGQNVSIDGVVNGNIRAAGGNVTVSATGVRALSVAAQTFSLDSDAKVSSDATVLGADINLKGIIGRDLTAASQTLTLNGEIGRDVKANVGTLTVRGAASVAGILNYTSSTKANVASGAKIVGGAHQTKTTKTEKRAEKSSLWGFDLVFYLLALAALSLISLLAVLLMPRAIVAAAEVARKRWALSLGIGFLSVVAIPTGLVLLAMTFIGLPLVVAILLAWGLLGFASGPVVAFAVGRMVLRKHAKNAVGVMALGSLVLVTAYFVPLLGFFVFIAAGWLGVGAALIALKNILPTPDYKL